MDLAHFPPRPTVDDCYPDNNGHVIVSHGHPHPLAGDTIGIVWEQPAGDYTYTTWAVPLPDRDEWGTADTWAHAVEELLEHAFAEWAAAMEWETWNQRHTYGPGFAA